MSRKIESFFVTGPAGRLEAMLEEPERDTPGQIALVCHPHPLHGGTMHNKVVHRLARALRANGCAVLRFNFRGVNLSAGTYDEGRGEVEDAQACLDELRRRYPALACTLAGFSFGSRVGLRLAERGGVRRVIAAGYPTVFRDQTAVERLRIPRIFVQSTVDEFGPREQLEALYNRLWEPKRLIWIEARDHFFTGALEAFENAVRALG